MTELIHTWFGPVTDTNGDRVPWRTSRPAFVLLVAAFVTVAATLALVVLMTMGRASPVLWGLTFFAAWIFLATATAQLRRSVQRAEP